MDNSKTPEPTIELNLRHVANPRTVDSRDAKIRLLNAALEAALDELESWSPPRAA